MGVYRMKTPERGFAFYPTAATDAAVRAAASDAYAAGGGTVVLPPTTVTLAAPLPVYPGVWYEGGAVPRVSPIAVNDGGYMGDTEWNYTGGSVLVGNGTFRAFEANHTDQASVDPNIGNTQISNFGISNVGLDGFTDGIRIGARNIMGLVWGKLDKIWVKNCSGWGVFLANFQHVQIGDIRTCLCQNGQYYASLMPNTTLMPGNCDMGALFNLIPRDGRDNRLCRGIVFDADGTNAQLNELTVRRVQCNGFNRNQLAVAADFTSASASIAVPDGTQFAVGMPVVFTATNYGVTSGYTYIVKSVSGNTITVANSRREAAITASGTGQLTVQTRGFPNVEITAAVTGAAVRSSRFNQVDVEGSATNGLYVEGANLCRIDIAEGPTTLTGAGIVGRGTAFTEINSSPALSNDFDASSTSSRLNGFTGAPVQRALPGFRVDTTSGLTEIRLSTSVAGSGSGGDLHGRASGMIYPNAGMGERVRSQNTAISLGSNLTGDIVFTGASAVTFTLPTIVTDTTPSASNIGMWFDVVNLGTAAVTLATSGSQLFNKVTALISITVAAGDAVRVVAVKDASSNLFWVAKRITLLTA